MKLLSTFQLATLFAKATMHARIFCICCAMTGIRPMVKSRVARKCQFWKWRYGKMTVLENGGTAKW